MRVLCDDCYDHDSDEATLALVKSGVWDNTCTMMWVEGKCTMKIYLY